MNRATIIFLAIGIMGILIAIWEGINYSEAINQKEKIEMEYIALQSKYSSLNNSYNQLQSSYTSLEQNYENLQQKYNLLNISYNNLNSSYSTLQSQYMSLQQEYNALQSDYSNLQNEYNQLQQNYSNLQQDYSSLQANYTQLSNEYNALQSDYETLQSDYSNLQNEYNAYKRRVEIRYGWGQNATYFVTPNDADVINYKNWILELYGIPSDGTLSWNDIDAIFDWFSWNIQYNYDTYIDVNTGCFYGEFWQYPNETLWNLDEWGYRLGDCEDFTVLMASLCKAEENVDWLWCAEVTLTINSTEYGHACIFVDDGDLMRIYDPTNNYTTGVSLSEEEALNQYATWWGAESIKVDAIFNENQYIEFASNQEFFDFF